MRTPPKPIRHHILSSRTAALLALAITAALHAPALGQITQRWLIQWGTFGDDRGQGVAADAAGTIWVAGQTGGPLGGPNVGSNDFFLTSLSATGVPGISVQRGGTGNDRGLAAAVVGGNTVFVAGITLSPAWDGAAILGNQDAAAVGYSTAGVWQSTTRFGSTGTDIANGAAGNASNLFVAGTAAGTIDGQAGIGGSDAFLSKRTSTGALVWTRVVGTAFTDFGLGAAFDSVGNAYVAGFTTGSLPTFTNAGGNDLFLARYDASGTRTLLKQLGTGGFDVANDVEVDGSGNIYVTGYSEGALGGQTNHGGSDALLTKLDSSGNLLWTRLLGGTGSDVGYGLALDAAGRVWIGGSTNSSFAGHTTAGNGDAFAASYDSAGTLLGTVFWGTSGDEQINGLAAAPDGGVVVTGSTRGALGAPNAGSLDAWVASLTTVPEPTTAALLLGGSAFLALRRRR